MSYASDKLKQYQSQKPITQPQPTALPSQQSAPQRTPISSPNVNPFSGPWYKQLLNPQVYKQTLQALPDVFNRQNRGTLAQAELGAGKQFANNTLGSLVRLGVFASPLYNPLTKDKLGQINKKSQEFFAPKNEAQQIGAPVGRMAGLIAGSEIGGAALSPVLRGLVGTSKFGNLLRNTIAGTATGQLDVLPGENRGKRAVSDAATIFATGAAGQALGSVKNKLASALFKGAGDNASYFTDISQAKQAIRSITDQVSFRAGKNSDEVYRAVSSGIKLKPGQSIDSVGNKVSKALTKQGFAQQDVASAVGNWTQSYKTMAQEGFRPINGLKSSNRTDKSVVDAYIKKIQNGEQVAPVVIDKKGVVVDGNNRLEAFRQLGIDNVQTVQGKVKVVDAFDKQAAKIRNEIADTGMSPEMNDYVNSLVGKQTSAKQVAKGSFEQRSQKFITDFRAKMADSAAPITDPITRLERKKVLNMLPTQDVRYKIPLVYRSGDQAVMFAKDNGLVDVYQGVTNQDAFNQYLIAKQAKDVAKAGFETGRNAKMDEQLIKELGPQYEKNAQAIYSYANKLLDKVSTPREQGGFGLISKSVADGLKKKYPNYVPLQRIFNEIDKAIPQNAATGGIASLSKQTAVQKLKGSAREIQNPLESLLLKTDTVFSQGARNDVARTLASYEKLPGNPWGLKELKAGESAAHTFSFLDNGVKRTFQATPEVVDAAKSLDRQQFNILEKVLAGGTRALKLGATGANVPFVASNIVKDQLTAPLLAKKAVLNPKYFIKGLASAVKHDALYDEWVRAGAGGTSFDISRAAPELSVAKLTSAKGAGTSAKYIARNPKEWLRAVEDLVGRSEEVTRLQQYAGTKAALLKQGRTLEDATILAADASRNNTLDFIKNGSWAKIFNSVVPYFSAAVRGGETYTRRLLDNPVKTLTKTAITSFLPLATVLAWNMNSPEKRKVYEDIKDYEKDNNFIIIPDNPTKDESGKWNVIKIPMSQSVSKIASPLRKELESFYGYDPATFADIASGLIGQTTGIDAQNPSQFVPQLIKTPLETSLNKNLYTGSDIVPDYLPDPKRPGKTISSKDLPPEQQVRPNTSGTARLLAKPFNISPLFAEQGVRTSFGGVGSQALNASDRMLALLGIIPQTQVGGRSIGSDIQYRFSKASGGNLDYAKARVEKTGQPERVGDYIVYKDKGVVKVKKAK